MKKFVSLLLATCMCLSIGAILTSCNKEHKHTFSSEWTYDSTHHWKEATCEHTSEKGDYAEHTLTNNVCTCGYSIYKVNNADEWNAVFTGEYLNNGTITIQDNYYANNVLDEEESYNRIMKSTGTAMVMIIENQAGTESQTQYLVKSGEKWYALANVSDSWYGIEMSQEFADSASFSKGQALTFVDKYSSFVYDEENNCYYAENFVLDEGNDDTTTVDDTIVNYIKFILKTAYLQKWN